MRPIFSRKFAQGLDDAREIVGLATVLLLLVAVPLLFTLLRTSTFESTVELAPTELNSESDLVVYVRSRLKDPLVADNIQQAAGFAIDFESLLVQMRVRRVKDGVSLKVYADRPERARNLAHGIGVLVSGASMTKRARRADTDLARLRRREAGLEDSLTRKEAERLKRISAQSRLLVIARDARAPKPESKIDEFVGLLPGPFPPRPHLLLICGSGLLVALLLLTLVWTRAGTRVEAGV